MRFNFALYSSFLVAAAGSLRPRVEQRTTAATSGNVAYSVMWSGADWQDTGETLNSVSSILTVPSLKWNHTKDDTAAFAAVIDGTSCVSGSLDVGIYLRFSEDNEPIYEAFYRVLSVSNVFNDFHVSAGDEVRLNVTATTPSSASVIVENLTNNDYQNIPILSSSAFCLCSAGWGVETTFNGSHPYPLAKFEDATFKEVVASGPQVHYTTPGNIVTNIKHGNRVLTSVSISSDGNSVTIHRL